MRSLYMFTQYKFKMKVFMAVNTSYVKWCISIVKNTIPIVDHSVVKGFYFYFCSAQYKYIYYSTRKSRM